MSDINFNSISNVYQEYIAKNARDASSSASKIDTTKDYSNASDEELMDACKKFEAYFLEQCFKEMLKTVKNDDEYSSASTSTLVDYFKDEMVQKLADQSTETNSLGLAQMLYEQMKRNYDL